MSDENVGGLVELMRCPGCGGDRTRVIGGPGTKGGPKFWAGCDLCRWRTWGNTEVDAILSWNTRVSAHGQPVVDGSVLSNVMNAQPFADKNDARRVWQLFRDDVHVGDAIRGIAAALTGATP